MSVMVTERKRGTVMKTVTIELIDGYFIEVDELNHTLKQRYQGETKDGEKSLLSES